MKIKVRIKAVGLAFVMSVLVQAGCGDPQYDSSSSSGCEEGWNRHNLGGEESRCYKVCEGEGDTACPSGEFCSMPMPEFPRLWICVPKDE